MKVFTSITFLLLGGFSSLSFAVSPLPPATDDIVNAADSSRLWCYADPALHGPNSDGIVCDYNYLTARGEDQPIYRVTIVKIQNRTVSLPNIVCMRVQNLTFPPPAPVTGCANLTQNGAVITFTDIGPQTDTDGDAWVNSYDPDDDNDGMPDAWEIQYGFNPLVNDANGDFDGDGIPNIQEYLNGSNPTTKPSVKNDYNNVGIAGFYWKGTSNGVETQNQIWQLTFPLYSANYAVPTRFYPPQFTDQANWELVTTGDFNKDGDADVLWRNKTTAQWKVWQMQNGTRTAQNTLADFDLSHEWTVVGAGDADKDGDDDVILNNTSTGEVLIWEMQNHAITATHSVGTKTGYTVNRIGDFNNDGDVDLLFREIGTDVLSIWEIEQNAFVSEKPFPTTGANYNPGCAGDFDNDGDDDILLLNTTDNQEKWFVMQNYTRTQTFGSTNIGFRFISCGDYDGDGDMDTLWQRTSDDANRVVLQQNFGVTKQTVYTNAFGGTNPATASYGFEYRGNSN